MGHADYRVELTGKILAGRNEEEVADALARLFKADADKVRRIFPGRLITIKTGLAEHAATRYRAAIEHAGAECRVVAESAPGALPTEVPGVDSAPRAAGPGSRLARQHFAADSGPAGDAFAAAVGSRTPSPKDAEALWARLQAALDRARSADRPRQRRSERATLKFAAYGIGLTALTLTVLPWLLALVVTGAGLLALSRLSAADSAAVDPGLVVDVMKVLPVQDPHRAAFALAAMRLWLNELDAKEAVVAAVETEHYALLESDRARAHAAYAWMRRLNAARHPFLAEPAFAPSPVTSPAAQRAEIDRVLEDKSLSCYVSGLKLVEHPGAPGQQGHALRLGLGEGYLWVSSASDPEWVRRLTGTTGSELRLRLRLDCVAMVDIRAEGSTPRAGSRHLRLRLHVPLPVSIGDSAGGVRKLDFDISGRDWVRVGKHWEALARRGSLAAPICDQCGNPALSLSEGGVLGGGPLAACAVCQLSYKLDFLAGRFLARASRRIDASPLAP